MVTIITTIIITTTEVFQNFV